jgi:hypothetical protein
MKNKIFNKFFDLIKDVDIMGPSPAINFEGQVRYRTVIGSLFTVVCFIIAISSISSTISSAIYKVNPSSYVNTVFDDKSILLNRTGFPMFINILSFDINTFQFTPIPKNEFGYPGYASINTNLTGFFLKEPNRSLIDCDDTVFGDYNSGFISEKSHLSKPEIDYLKSISICLPPGDTLINTAVDAEDWGLIPFPLVMFKDVLKKYPYVAIKFTWRNMLLTPNNYTNYYKRIWKEYFFIADTSKQYYFKFDLENYHLAKDQSVFLLQDVVETDIINGVKIEPWITLNRQINDQDWFAAVIFNKSNLSTDALIKYTSLNDIISDFGGSFGILFSIFSILLSFVVDRRYDLHLIDNVFKFYYSDNSHYPEKRFLPFLHERSINRDFKKDDLPINELKRNNELLLIKSNVNEKLDSGIISENKNNYFQSIDRGGCLESDISRVSREVILDPANQDFINESLKKVQSRRKINLLKKYGLVGYLTCFRGKEFKKLGSALEGYEKSINDHLCASKIISNSLNMEKMMKIMFSKIEQQIVVENYVNVNNEHEGRTDKRLDDETVLRDILNWDLKDKRKKKVLRYYLQNNF